MGQKVKAGDSGFSATEFNRHVDTADFVLGQQILGMPSIRRTAANDSNFLSLKNGSGADRRQGEILEITGNVLADFTSRDCYLTGGAPTMANAFAVLGEPIANSESSPHCQLFGRSIALVNIISTGHKFASPKNGLYVLQSAPAGPVRILSAPGSTGEQTCALFLTGDSTQLVKPTADRSKGTTSIDCTVWLNNTPTSAVLPLIPLGADVKSGKQCVAWGGYVWPWECG